MLKSYKDLIVWQKSFRLAVEVYKITLKFPKSKLYGLTSQIRRAAFAIPIFRIVFRDYLAAITTALFLLGFWWFSYSFVLEERVDHASKNHVRMEEGRR